MTSFRVILMNFLNRNTLFLKNNNQNINVKMIMSYMMDGCKLWENNKYWRKESLGYILELKSLVHQLIKIKVIVIMENALLKKETLKKFKSVSQSRAKCYLAQIRILPNHYLLTFKIFLKEFLKILGTQRLKKWRCTQTFKLFFQKKSQVKRNCLK